MKILKCKRVIATSPQVFIMQFGCTIDLSLSFEMLKVIGRQRDRCKFYETVRNWCVKFWATNTLVQYQEENVGQLWRYVVLG